MDILDGSALGNLAALDYLLIALTAAGSAMVSAMSGMGGGLLLAIVVAPIVGVKLLVPLIAVQSVFTNLGRIAFYFRQLDARIAMLVFWPSVAGSYLGTAIYAALDPGTLSLLLGIFLMLSVPLRRILAGRNVVAGTRTLLVMGFIFGVVSGTSVGAGIILVPVLLGAGLMGPALLGTDAIVGVLNTVFRAVMYAWHGLLPVDILIAGVLIGICTFPGSWAAAWIVKRTDVRLHTAFMELLVLGGGGTFIWRAGDFRGWW